MNVLMNALMVIYFLVMNSKRCSKMQSLFCFSDDGVTSEAKTQNGEPMMSIEKVSTSKIN